MKSNRHSKILELISQESIDTQEGLLIRLRESGFDVTQATVSRDIRELGIHKVRAENGKYPAAMLAKELAPGALDGRKWIYRDSPVMAISEEDARRYDDTLEKLEKRWLPSQEEFYILSHSSVE